MDRLIHIITLSCQTSECYFNILYCNTHTNIAFSIAAFVFHQENIKIIRFLYIDTRVRLVTLELTIKLLTQLTVSEGQCLLQESHLAAIEAAKEQSTSLLKNFYKVGIVGKLYINYRYTCASTLSSRFAQDDMYFLMKKIDIKFNLLERRYILGYV